MEKFRVLPGIDRRTGEGVIPRLCSERARKNCVAYHVRDYHKGIERRSEFWRRAVEKRRNGKRRRGNVARMAIGGSGGSGQAFRWRSIRPALPPARLDCHVPFR